jgi:LPXTG-site transpeptidase (sortase) family protein
MIHLLKICTPRHQMAVFATGRELCRWCAMALCCGIASLALTASASTNGGQQAQGGAIDPPTPARTLIWIQDPWSGGTVLTSFPQPDQSLWNAKKIKLYEEALKADFPPPLGLLVISDLNIEIPIYNGTEEHILDRGAGRIKGMAKMNENGNLGISAHRDSFFRGLKDIELGDVVLVQSAYGVEKYAVSDINIVPKEDVSVLAPVERKTLTLVTCYPFYHVGAAPKRFIVTALPVSDEIE